MKANNKSGYSALAKTEAPKDLDFKDVDRLSNYLSMQAQLIKRIEKLEEIVQEQAQVLVNLVNIISPHCHFCGIIIETSTPPHRIMEHGIYRDVFACDTCKEHI
jgi:hypothetical protein